MNNQVSTKFSDYYEKWMGQLEEDLKFLLLASRERNQETGFCEAVVDKLTSQHKEFYKVKWALAHEDVLAFFNPSWLSPLENAYLWVTGWKPSMAFRLVDTLSKAEPPSGGSLRGMTEDQARMMEALRAKIRAEEERVEREMERQQVSVADRKVVELVRLEIQARKSGGAEAVARVNELVEETLRGMVAGLEKVMKMADCVRLKTLKGVLEVLTPRQCVDFLAATSMLQIQTRKWGIKKETMAS